MFAGQTGLQVIISEDSLTADFAIQVVGALHKGSGFMLSIPGVYLGRHAYGTIERLAKEVCLLLL